MRLRKTRKTSSFSARTTTKATESQKAMLTKRIAHWSAPFGSVMNSAESGSPEVLCRRENDSPKTADASSGNASCFLSGGRLIVVGRSSKFQVQGSKLNPARTLNSSFELFKG